MRNLFIVFAIAFCYYILIADSHSEAPNIKGKWGTDEGYVEIYEVKSECTSRDEKPIHKHLKEQLCRAVGLRGTVVCGRVIGTKSDGKAIMENIGANEDDAKGLPIFCAKQTNDGTWPWQGRVFQAKSIKKKDDGYTMKEYHLYISQVISEEKIRILKVDGCFGPRVDWPKEGVNCERNEWEWIP